MANYLDDLKKKGQQVANVAQNVASGVKQGANTVKQYAPGVVNAAKETTQNVIGGVNNAVNTGKQVLGRVNAGVDRAIDTGKELYGAANAGVNGAINGVKDYYSNNQQGQTDWAAEYDRVMSEGQAQAVPNSSGAGGTSQGGGNQQPNVSPVAQEVLGAGASQWQAELDGIMNQIMNREKFSYDMNGDAMYQQYADIYKNQANLGMENAMAQAAALSGGYGSSYGQMVGQQAYAQQMQGLNEIGLDLYDRAYNQYQEEGNQLAQQYAMLADREQQAYNRGIDERNFEYQKYLDELEQSNYEKEFDYRADRDAVADERYETEWAASEEQRGIDNSYRDRALDQDNEQFYAGLDQDNEQFYAGLDHDSSENALNREHDVTMQNDAQDFQSSENALDRDHDILMQDDAQKHASDMQEDEQNWQAEEFDKLYGENGFYTKQNEQTQENWQADFDRDGEWYDDAQEAANPNTTYEGEGALNGQSVPKQLAGVPGLTTTNTGLFDENGYFKQAAVVNAYGVEGKPLTSGSVPTAGVGTMTYNIGGKEVTVKTGTSPYTNRVNPDAKNGVFSNGYQPDNIGGSKLTEGETEALVNGQWVPTYTTDDGAVWAYDAANNEYIPVPTEEEPDQKEESGAKEEVYKPTNNTTVTGGGGGKRPVYIAHD